MESRFIACASMIILVFALLTLPVSAQDATQEVDEFTRMLDNADAEIRLKGIRGLLGTPWSVADAAYQGVMRMLDDPDVRVRATAATITFRRGDSERGKQVLLELLDSTDGTSRLAALNGLQSCWTKDQDFNEPLLRLVDDPDENISFWAAYDLNQRKAEQYIATEIIYKIALSSKAWGARKQGLLMLGRLAPENELAVKGILAAFDDRQSDNINVAASLLPRLGVKAAPIIPRLTGMVDDECYSCLYHGVSNALIELGKMPETRDLVNDGLIGTLDSEDMYAVGSALEIFEGMKTDDPRVRDAIIRQFDRDVYEIRYMAAMTLTYIFTTDADTVAPLTDLLSDKDKNVRGHAINALGARGELASQAVPLLIDNLRNHFFAPVRESAAEALGRIDPENAKVVAALTAAVSDSDEAVAIMAIEVLTNNGVPSGEFRERLTELAGSDSKRIAKRSQVLLNSIGGS